MKVPCEQCISLAICKQRETIKCNKLYDYMTVSNKIPKGFKAISFDREFGYSTFDNTERVYRKFMPKHNERLRALELIWKGPP